MEDALLSIALILIMGKLLEGAAIRLQQNALVAYVATGIILGPVADVVEPTEQLEVFFGLGVFFMFFLIGVDEVVQPQQGTGRQLAHVLGANISDYIEVGQDYGVALIAASPPIIKQTCAEVESKHGVTVLVIGREAKVIVAPSSKEQVQQGDMLVVAGKDQALRKLGSYVQES